MMDAKEFETLMRERGIIGPRFSRDDMHNVFVKINQFEHELETFMVKSLLYLTYEEFCDSLIAIAVQINPSPFMTVEQKVKSFLQDKFFAVHTAKGMGEKKIEPT